MLASMCSLGILLIWLPKQTAVYHLYRTSTGFAQNQFLPEVFAMWVVMSSLLLCTQQHLRLECGIQVLL